MSSKNSLDKQVSLAETAIARMLAAQRNEGRIDSGKWLEALFKHYSDRMLSDNERIWRTATLFVPISLAAFAALAGIRCVGLLHVVMLAIPSVTLMCMWVIAAENHRAFQEKNEAWLRAIQRAVGLELPKDSKAPLDGTEAWVVKPGAIRNIRWTLLCMVVAMWAFLIVAAVRRWLPSNCQL